MAKETKSKDHFRELEQEGANSDGGCRAAKPNGNDEEHVSRGVGKGSTNKGKLHCQNCRSLHECVWRKEFCW